MEMISGNIQTECRKKCAEGGCAVKKARVLCCLLMCFCVLMTFSACGEGKSYRIIDTYSAEGSYVIAFRQGDRLCDFVTAALQELADNGTLRSASIRWFGDDLISVRGSGGEMDELWSEVPERVITVGVDITNMPMSYIADGGYVGFDVDLASYICSYLGWELAVYPIDPENVDVELQSGNIDMAMGISESDAKSDFSYSPAYLSSRYVLVASVSGRVRDKSAMKGKCLGVTVTDLDVLMQDEKFVESLGSVTYQTNTEGLFQALLSGEVDGILVSSVVAAHYMNIE